jgi:hypothetical protein
MQPLLNTPHLACLLTAHGLAGELEPIQTLDRGPLYHLDIGGESSIGATLPSYGGLLALR